MFLLITIYSSVLQVQLNIVFPNRLSKVVAESG